MPEPYPTTLSARLADATLCVENLLDFPSPVSLGWGTNRGGVVMVARVRRKRVKNLTRFSEDAGRMFLTRTLYDTLVTRFPDWMATVWPKLIREWIISGVLVTGCAGSGLATRVNSLILEDVS